MATLLKRSRDTLPYEEAPHWVRESLTKAPRVTAVVRPEVLRTIASFAGDAPGKETGGPLIGTTQRSWDQDGDRLILAILATVPPGPALQAGAAHVELGYGGDGERAASAVRWWRAVTGLDLRHVGDWHKHHSGSPEPSSGDALTARGMSAANDAPVWITGVAVGAVRRHERVEASGPAMKFLRSRVAYQEVRFYRAMDRLGLVPLTVRVEGEAVPQLPALPWHVGDPARFSAECRLLKEAGFRVAIESWSGEVPGLALQLKKEGFPPMTVVTGSRYPVQFPVVLDHNGRGLELPEDWSPARFLIDAVNKRS